MADINRSLPEEGSASPDFQFPIDDAQAGHRLDRFLCSCLEDVSRALINDSLTRKLILVNGEVKKKSYRLRAGDQVAGCLCQPAVIDLAPEPVDFTILHEDDHLLVLSKPPGLVVHPGSGNSSGTLVNGLLHHCAALSEVGDELRPGIVHRLDKDTSGAMVVAKDSITHRYLVEQFKNRTVKKEYVALVCGRMERPSGRIVAAIGRHSVNRQKMAVREPSGRYAATSWQLLHIFEQGYSLLRLKIETGRTHQIRVHMSHLGHPVAGDQLYGRNSGKVTCPRQLLHAATLGFIHPVSTNFMSFKAPLWADFSAALLRLDPGLDRLVGELR
ncbi:MAG: RluA family pseudouridine synthase [Thermodesulfobacteriota bacterium]